MALRDGVLPFLVDTARRLLGPAPSAVGASQDLAPVAVSRIDAARQDCGPGGCGAPPGDWFGYDAYDLPGFASPLIGLTREQIDAVCVETLMDTVVTKIVEDACRETPTLAGEHLGELTGCVSWLGERGWHEADEQAQCYSRYYGGGGVVCIVDDGRPPDQEVDISAVRGVEGFFALSKWNIIPDDAGSPRVRAGWYGQRFGRPEHYIVSPDQPPLRGMPYTDASSAAAAEVLALGGRRWHRSRIVPRPFRDKMDLRMARRFSIWRGWGPGAVEGCLASYLARREGALHTNEVLRASHFNVLTTPNVAHSQSTPAGASAIDNTLAWIRACLARTRVGGGVPIVAVDPVSRMEAISHTLSGISEILREQRQFFLDNVPEYPEVVLMPGSGNSGLSGDGKEGEWQAYDNNVMAYRQSKVWTAGAFGGGMRQAVILSMACRTGPTRGQVDLTVRPTWTQTRRGTTTTLADARLKRAQARAMDKATLGLTTHAFLRHDPTLAGAPDTDYPSLDVDEAPLPEVPPGDGDALAPATSTGGDTAITPAGAVSAMNASATDASSSSAPASPAPVQDEAPDFAPAAADPNALQQAVAASFPADIATERQLAQALLMTPRAFQKWVAQHPAIERYPMPPGTRGGARYSLGEVLEAFKASAVAKVDAMRTR